MKLLFILLLGLGFTQTKLETRLYEMDVDLSGHTVNIKNLTDTDLPYYSVRIFAESIKGGSCKFKVENSLNGYIDFQHEAITGSTHAVVDDFYLIGSGNTDLIFSTLWNNSCGEENVQFWVTANFPEEDTGYMEEGFQFCVEPGANLVSFPCDIPVAVSDALPQGIENYIYNIIGQGEAATSIPNQVGYVGGLEEFTPGSGYWFKSNSSLCFEYECVEG